MLYQKVNIKKKVVEFGREKKISFDRIVCCSASFKILWHFFMKNEANFCLKFKNYASFGMNKIIRNTVPN